MLVEPDISPLAKRLAEENNVNWRGLLGSGAGGKIVERDVLEYLAKVMAGEEDINPTAEPLPEGMEAWPEDDVRSFYGGAVPVEAEEAPASVAEEDLFVDTPDLGGFDAPMAASGLTQLEDTSGLGEDIFLIDDDAPMQTSLDVSNMTADPAFASDFSADIAPFTEEVLSSDDITLADDSLGIDEISTFDDTDSEVFAAMSEGIEDAFVSDNDVEDLASLFVEEIEGVEDSSYGALNEPTVIDQTVTFEAPTEPDFEIPAYTTDAVEDIAQALASDSVDDVITSFEEESIFEAVSDPQDSFVTKETASYAPDQAFMVEEPMVETPMFETPSARIPVAEESPPMQPIPTFTEIMPVMTAVAGAGIVGLAVSEAPVSEVPISEVPMSEVPVLTPSPVVSSHLPLVSYGVLLRRHVDLSVLMHAQQAIAEEMGQEESGSVASLLLRAAAKAQQKVPLVSGSSIGLAVIRDQGVSVVHVHDAASAPFRTVMSQTHRAFSEHQTDKVDLAVTDMSSFDIDEAVLNIGVPVLTLGRTLYDSSKGTHHSTLSLSGNVSVESGTRFLSVVAELLDSPVRLVI